MPSFSDRTCNTNSCTLSSKSSTTVKKKPVEWVSCSTSDDAPSDPPCSIQVMRIGFFPRGYKHLAEKALAQKAQFDCLAAILKKKRKRPDVRVKIDDIAFNCHSQYLRIYSEVFENSFRHESEVILPIGKIPPRIFKLIYRWICNKEIYVASTNLEALYKAAKFLRMPLLLWNILEMEAVYES